MSAVIAADAAGAAPAKGGKKKLLVIVAVAVAVLLLLGAGAVVILKRQAAARAAALADDDGTTASAKTQKSHEQAGPPTYLPLDPFVVNLADTDGDRYAQIGITLEIENSVTAEQMRGYMPSIRNAILMVITRKTSKELLDPHGKEQLAAEIAREAVRPMGIDIPAPLPAASAPAGGEAAAAVPAKRPQVKNPIRHVNFSSFIIQ